MEYDYAMPIIIGMLWLLVLISYVLRRLRQPYVVSYLVAGIIFGPDVLGLVQNEALVHRLGEFGVMLLLFFIGMEINLPRLLRHWKVSLTTTLAQILFSFLLVWLLNHWLGWPLARCLLLAFVISLSSTAVIMKILQEWHELDTRLGETVVGILIIQDILIVPMMVILSFVSRGKIEQDKLILQIIAMLGIGVLLFLVVSKRLRKLPFARYLRRDRELQVFSGLGICFSMALLTGLMGVSTALGAFVGGVMLGATKEASWVNDKLDSIRVIFVALFFLSIGMLLDLDFVMNNMLVISILVMAVLFLNNLVISVFLKLLGRAWRESVYAGSLLSQIGEFSFVLAATGLSLGIVADYAYQLSIAVIALSLIISPLWIISVKKLVHWA
jgi:CPA2 family monovalent cation:H+ antiporter-2